jgi:DNA-binding winged helix-turn-helix (wHTH) protein/Tol biopolymer transport system component
MLEPFGVGVPRLHVNVKSTVRFADFELDLSTGELCSNGNVTYLQEKPFRILSLLLEHPGQLITREQLVKHLWPDGTFVDFDQSLNKAVNRLREALGDSADEPRLIETLPRRGYRFIGQVENHVAPEVSTPVVVDGPQSGDSRRSRWLAWFPLLVLTFLVIALGVLGIVRLKPHRNPLEDIKQRQLTSNSSENAVASGVISTDGKLLAYSDVQGIHIEQIETGQVRDIPLPDVFKGAPQSWGLVNTWIRDGSAIVANLAIPGRPPSVWLVSLPGGSIRKVRDNALAWAVSRDGQWVAFGANLNHLYYRELWVMHPDGSDAHKVFDAETDTAFGGAEFSPDGRRMAYVRLLRLPDRSDMTFESRPIEDGPAITAIGSLNPRVANDWAWSPDGRIIYALLDKAKRTDNFWQVRIDARTGKPAEPAKQLTNWSGYRMDGPSFSADGKRLTYLRSSEQSVLYLADLRAGGIQIGTPDRMTLHEGINVPVGWMEDGKTVIYFSDRNGHPQLFRQVMGTENAEPIGAKLEDSAADAHLSPDGARILYLVYSTDSNWAATNPNNLMSVRVTGGAPQLVARSMDDASPSIRCARRPSALCVLAEETPNHTQLVFTAINPLQGRGRELARHGILTTPDAHYDWDVSPDGTRIAILKESELPITVLSLVDHSSRTIVAKAWPKLYGLNWSADGEGLFVSALANGGCTLLHVDMKGNAYPLWYAKGGVRQPGDVFRSDILTPRAVPSPDGRSLIIQESSVSANIWMLENF